MVSRRARNMDRRATSRNGNRRGPRNVNFEDDHPMAGLGSSPRKTHFPNRRGGRKNHNPTRDRAAPYHSGNNDRNRDAFPFASSQNSQRRHQQSDARQGIRGQRGNNHHNPNNRPNNIPNHKRNRRRRRGGVADDDAILDDGENDSVDIDIDSLFGSSLPIPRGSTNHNHHNHHNHHNPNFDHPHPHHHHHNRRNSSPSWHDGNANDNTAGPVHARTCTECSSVRRANLRFRNWAARALRRCGERFAAWAEDAGVGFATADEMDWQPEPVVRVLLLGGTPELGGGAWSPGGSMHYGGGGGGGFLLNQQQQQQQQEQYYQQQMGMAMAMGQMGSLPAPGPWAWPPWSAGGGGAGMPPIPPSTAAAAGTSWPWCMGVGGDGGGAYNNNNNNNSNGPMPISGFGLLGAGIVETPGPLSNHGLDAGAGKTYIPVRSAHEPSATSAWFRGLDSPGIRTRAREELGSGRDWRKKHRVIEED